MKEATTRPIGVIDSSGTVIASSELSLVGTYIGVFTASSEESSDKTVKSFGRTFRFIGGTGSQYDYAVFVDGEDEYAKTVCIMAYIAICEAKTYYEENHDNAAFIKNIISNNILPGDIYVRAKELRFAADAPRAVFLIRQLGHGDVSTVDVLSGMFPNKQQDFVLSINESDIAVVKQLSGEVPTSALEKMARSMEDTLKNELFIKTVIGIGTVAEHLRSLADSYKEAQTAIDVGKVFDTEKSIINYENLGIGRLIYQLPTTLCEIFLSEVFKKSAIDSLDQETLFTINKFFENNLNVSETSRKLFVHRNTLVYRLEKIKKLTGLDLREFDHAIVFKVALMVRKYLSSRDIR